MDKEIIKDNKIKLIICIILSLSIFSIYIPINTGGYFTIIMWFVQIIIPIIFGVLIKEYKNFLYSDILKPFINRKLENPKIKYIEKCASFLTNLFNSIIILY